jgi:hypothetical protein
MSGHLPPDDDGEQRFWGRVALVGLAVAVGAGVVLVIYLARRVFA